MSDRPAHVQVELGKANTSAGHQTASDRKARVALEAKVEKLEAKIQAKSATEKELRQELDTLLESEKTNDNSVSHFFRAVDGADDIV